MLLPRSCVVASCYVHTMGRQTPSLEVGKRSRRAFVAAEASISCDVVTDLLGVKWRLGGAVVNTRAFF